MKIRPHAQVIIVRDGKLFCVEGKDTKKDEVFYRTPGGGIDFGEYAKDALAREMIEEFDAKVVNLQQVALDENIFIYDGQQGHEIVFVFTGDFEDESMYEDKFYEILDSQKGEGARWQPIDQFISGDRILYPKRVLDYLKDNYGTVD